MVTLDVTKEYIGRRLDKYIQAVFTNLPISYIQRLLRQKKIKVNYLKADGGYRLEKRDQINFYIQEAKLTGKVKAKKRKPLVKKITFKIGYDDHDLLIVNKPPNLCVHHNKENSQEITLLDQVYKYLNYDETQDKPFLAHRLDRDTSGLVIIGKTKRVYQPLFDIFKNRLIEKEYKVLVAGHLKEKTGFVDLPILKIDKGQKKVRIDREKGKSALTEYKVLQETLGASLLRINLKSGRTHQIRIHLSTLGHPVIGDNQYGDREINKEFRKQGIKRQFIHATNLKFQHPITQELLDIKTEIFKDLKIFS